MEIARWAGVLAEDERARAQRYVVETARRQFVAGRAALRLLLSRYLGVAAPAIRFSYGAQGKPGLLWPSAPVAFNLSHSGGIALYAFSLSGRGGVDAGSEGIELGIDVEEVRPLADLETLAGRYFSPDESAALRRLPPGDRPRAFFACWTRKEAVLKAHGGGLAVPLDDFDVVVDAGQPAALLRTRIPGDSASRWWLEDLPVPAGFAAALAVRKPGSAAGAGPAGGRALPWPPSSALRWRLDLTQGEV